MDAIALLTRHGHRVTRRPDGLYDVTMYGRAVTFEQVMDLWVAVQTWPIWFQRTGPPVSMEQFWAGPEPPESSDAGA
jgi:hypothetical protein